MPPFLYNRMAQPLSSFPVPPPLPQVASLPLTPAVQQIVAQRYSNPVAVLPFPSNWPVSQPAIPSYVPAIQQQQQYVPPAPQMYTSPPIINTSPPVSVPTYAVAPYSAALPQQQQQQQYVPQAPQTYTSPPIINIPPPVSAPTYAVAPYSAALPQQQQQQQYVPQAPQTYTSPPIINVPPPPPTFVPSFQPDAQIPIGPPPPPLAAAAPASYYQPAPQANFPVSVASESSSSLSSSINVQSSSSNSNTVSSALAVQPAAPQYSYNTYPSICRACPPAPPPLNIPVTGYCWIQHCSACHHVPLANSYPNNRPAGGRNTPLLRQSTVPQYVPEQSYQHYRATDPPVMMRPWLRKTPPLPPGAVVISDEYVYKNGSTAPHSYSQRSSRRSDRSPHKKYRSTTTTTTTRTGYGANTFSARSMSPRKAYYNNNNSTNPSTNASQLQRSNGLKTAQSPSASTTSSNLSSEYERITIPPTIQTQKTAMPGPIAREARNVNLKYNYQPQELPTVYNVNPYLKSSSEASSLSTNTERKFHDRSPYMKNSNSIASSTEQEDDKPSRPPSHLKKAIKNKVLVIREFTTNSPSTISTISSNISFSIINKDEDSLSITSTIDEHKQEENDTLQRHIF